MKVYDYDVNTGRERVYFYPPSPQEFLVMILSASEGLKADLSMIKHQTLSKSIDHFSLTNFFQGMSILVTYPQPTPQHKYFIDSRWDKDYKFITTICSNYFLNL